MKRTSTFVLALFGIACRPPLPSDPQAEGESGDDGTATSATSATSTTSATETSETSGTESTESTETGFDTQLPGFALPYDLGSGDPCDPFMQDCPNGEKCVTYGTVGDWGHKCVPVLGDQAPGEPCHYSGTMDSLDDCDQTSFCWNVNSEGIGVCTLFCTGTGDMPECPEGSSCTVCDDCSFELCVSTCDPLLQDCEQGLACFWASYGFNCIFTTQELPPGAACEFNDQCAGDNGCVAAEVLPGCDGSACCTPWCDTDLGDAQCAAVPGTSCVPFFEQGMAPPGYEQVGVCILPP